jgi:hypothetical protein
MDNLESNIMKRINCIDLDVLCDIVDTFKKYNVNFYNRKGVFEFNKFRNDCIKTSKILFKKDKPVNGIRYQLCDFLSAIQTLVGIRNMTGFMSK